MKTMIEQLAKKLQKIGSIHAVGDVWLGLNDYVPTGVLLCNGKTYSKETYKDLWQWVKNTNQVRDVSDYESMKIDNAGQCPYFCDVDDTHFGMPVLTAYPMFGSPTETFFYKKAGLPSINHKHVFGSNNGNNQGGFIATSKVIEYQTDNGVGKRAWNGNGGGGSYESSKVSDSNLVTSNPIASNGSMSLSNGSIWGSSNTVTPETNIIQVGVYAIGAISTIGTLDLNDSLTRLEQIAMEISIAKEGLRSVASKTNIITKTGNRGELSGYETITDSTDESFEEIRINKNSPDVNHIKTDSPLTINCITEPSEIYAVKILRITATGESGLIVKNGRWSCNATPPDWGKKGSVITLAITLIANEAIINVVDIKEAE